jgi:hypothetical protein
MKRSMSDLLDRKKGANRGWLDWLVQVGAIAQIVLLLSGVYFILLRIQHWPFLLGAVVYLCMLEASAVSIHVAFGSLADEKSSEETDEKSPGKADEVLREAVELLRAERDKLAELAVEIWGDDWPSKLDEWMKWESDKRQPSDGRCHCPELGCPCLHRFCPCIAFYLDPGALVWDDADCPCLNRAKNYKGDYDPWRAGSTDASGLPCPGSAGGREQEV